ncbi:MAG: hypothetical protein JSU73_13100 [candidate division WOR-3 bacterium]|nr:MAG: hypothetical protein JSU73_13100 [candidate division WOR-3 bacterium]
MSSKKFPKPGFELTADGLWKCLRCGHTEYVRVQHGCRSDQYFREYRPHKEGHKVDKKCPGKGGRRKHVMLRGFLRCDLCWPYPVRITNEMRAGKGPGMDTTEKK